ncbi:MAG: 3-dehydroquinate synthase [Longimicrobiales bacterium]
MTRITVDTPAPDAASYDVLVEPGALDRLSALLGATVPADRYAVITDETVARLHGGRVLDGLRAAGFEASVYAIPPGEAEKTRARWAELTDRLLADGLGRDAAVLALGGGVIGDLAGFVAATYMRGLPLVQLPTTLLAMVDASVGGKTAVDTPAGKNLVGSMLQPRLVVADPDVLGTLPPEHVRVGLAEAAKHGAIASAEYLDWMHEHAATLLGGDVARLAELVRRSVEVKAAFVARDPLETGPRKALNFGHTVGHALETLSGYRLLHGLAVAIGMSAEARLGEALGVTAAGTAARLGAALDALGLPRSLPGDVAPEALTRQARVDKKARAGRTRYTLLRRIGEVARGPDGDWSIPIDDVDVERALTATLEADAAG